jgi:serine/threonine-protein kinase
VTLEAGSRVGPYRVVEVLGQGGMASVYRAHDPGLERDVALKVLAAEFLRQQDFAERFRSEAKFSAMLEHPHIVPIHAFGIDDGVPWMAMRLIPGGHGGHLIKAGPLPLARAIRVLRDVASALDYAHNKGVIHRDVKPHNILLDEDERAYLADFGIARILEGSAHLTRTGMIVGTPQYMAPEQSRTGVELDRRIDVYALGVVAYELLTGKPPFHGNDPVAVLMSHVMEEMPQPDPAVVAEPVADALRKCLAKDRQFRWASAGAFVDGLESAQARAAEPKVAPAIPPAASTGGSGAATSTPAAPSAPTPAEGARRGSRLMLAGVIAAALVLAGVVWTRIPRSPSTPGPAAKPSPRGTATVAAAPSAPARTPVERPPRNAKRGDSWTGRDGLAYVFVPAASFKIGCVPGDKGCYDDEKPRQTVTLAAGFWMTKTEVTVGAYKRFAVATGRSLPSEAPRFNVEWSRDDMPMSYVSWDDAADYCSWIDGRLPMEAEWEYAGRAGRDGDLYPWGQLAPVCREGAPNGARFNDGMACKDGTPGPVAAYGPNSLGLADMAGNVWEWCQDRYDPRAYAADAKPPSNAKERIIRGGAANAKAPGLRLSLRNRMVPATRSIYVGFRCAIDAP